MDPRKVKWQQTLISISSVTSSQCLTAYPTSLIDIMAVNIHFEFNDLPSFVSDAGSYPAIRELLLGQFSNFLEARWLIWNSFNELEVEV
ncbi:hypothetical protein D5086_005971 [Populus alba]|uniref:Uncharacterized protein n=1 Tax=Populus alba TaxID=43335 RepID=A0ACC4CLD8_POPAL